MTTRQYLEWKYPEMGDIEIEFLISSSVSIYRSITKYDEVRAEHENWITRCCVELIERADGGTGAVSFSENGKSVTFDRTQVSQGLLDELPNNATMYSRGGVKIVGK